MGRARLRHRRINRVAVLIAEGRMQPVGLAAFDARSQLKTGIYAVEQEAPELTAADIRTFKTNTAAWKSFAARTPGCRLQMSWRVASGKREETSAKRLQHLIGASASVTWLV